MIAKARRERGPSYPRKRPEGPWEAVSFIKAKRKYVRTRHHSREAAEKRLIGVSHRHEQLHIIDHSPPVVAAEVKEAAGD